MALQAFVHSDLLRGKHVELFRENNEQTVIWLAVSVSNISQQIVFRSVISRLHSQQQQIVY